MGSFHRRKPAAKKAPKQQSESAEDIAARQAKEQFIKDMAAKAAVALPPSDAEIGGIHPSRLARTMPGAAPQNQFAGRQGPPRGQRAPDLRQNNKRTFDDANQMNGAAVPAKKQRTLQEIRKLKGPAAMQKEEEKRRKQALKEQEEAQARRATQEKKESGPQSDDEDAQIPSKAKKGITGEKESPKSAEDKAARKAAKAARKAAKKGGQVDQVVTVDKTTKADEPEAESKEARKARRKAEKEQKKAAENANTTTDSTTEVTETKEEKKARKKLAKEAAKADTGKDDGAKTKKSKKEKKAKAVVDADTVSVTAMPKPVVTDAPTSTTNWSQAASSLGSKSSKFLKLMGGAKSGIDVATNQTSNHGNDKAQAARRAEKELERHLQLDKMQNSQVESEAD